MAKVELTFNLSADVYEALQHRCRVNKIALSDLLQTWCQDYVKTGGQADPQQRLPHELAVNKAEALK